MLGYRWELDGKIGVSFVEYIFICTSNYWSGVHTNQR